MSQICEEDEGVLIKGKYFFCLPHTIEQERGGQSVYSLPAGLNLETGLKLIQSSLEADSKQLGSSTWKLIQADWNQFQSSLKADSK